ncbi:HepT-like ribonuclease domain-containing protein [Nitratifractor sp.]
MSKRGRDYRLYLDDILAECENIRMFVDRVSYEEFADNVEKVYAVAKAFENIGEAVKNLPSEIVSDYPEIPWSEIAKMRDVLTHHYFGVDDRVLWETIEEDLDRFEETVKAIMRQSGTR